MNNFLITTIFLMINQICLPQQKDINLDLIEKVKKVSSELITPPSTPIDPVTVNTAFVWSKDKKQIAIVLKATIAEGWHIYEYVPKNQPYISSKLELKLPVALKTIGEWQKPFGEPYGDGIYVYQGSKIFVQYCLVDDYNKDLKIDCGLYYQACDLRKCFPPRTKSKILRLK